MLCELAKEMLDRPSSWPFEVILRTASDLFFAKILTVNNLLTLLKRAVSAGQEDSRFMTGTLLKIVETIQPDSDLGIELRNQLADSIWAARKEYTLTGQLNSEFDKFTTALAKLCNRQLAEASSHLPEDLTRACVMAFHFGSDGEPSQNDVLDMLRAHFETNENRRSEAFWTELSVMAEYPLELDRWAFQRQLSVSLVGGLTDADRSWLQRDIVEFQTEGDFDPATAAALQEFLDIQIEHRREKEAERLHQFRFQPGNEPPNLETWRKWREDLMASPRRAFSNDRRKETLWKIFLWLDAFARAESILATSLPNVQNRHEWVNVEEAPSCYQPFPFRTTDTPSGYRYGVWNGDALKHAFGKEVTEFAASAFQEIWRTMPAPAWSDRKVDERDRPLVGWIYGLQGLLIEATTPNWAVDLSSDAARIAAAYATIELNGFAPFLSDLEKSQRQEVEGAIGDELIAELRICGDQNFLPVLSNLACAGQSLKQLFVPRLCQQLNSWPDVMSEDKSQNWTQCLELVLDILHSACSGRDREAVGETCVRRYQADPAAQWQQLGLRGRFGSMQCEALRP